MKKIISSIILICIVSFNALSTFAESLPSLPNLPSEPEFDTVLPPDGADVFAPSETPSQTVTKPVSLPAQNTQSTGSTIKVTPVQKTTQDGTKSQTSTINPPPKQTPNTGLHQTTQAKETPQKPINTANNSYYKNNLKNAATIHKGKKFKVKLAQSISSSSPVGTKLTFKSIYPETSTYITIPAGTTFYGKITDSHQPQITGNGGLIVIQATQMVYNGKTYQIDAKISVANKKKIFFNNIKGQRMYLRSIPKAIKPGAKYFGKMWKVTKKLAKNESGVEIILTPFSLAAGTVVYVANIVASPVMALFYKGKSITIPANSQYTIQLREDLNIIK